MLDAFKRWWSKQDVPQEAEASISTGSPPPKRKYRANPTKFQGAWDQLYLARKARGAPVSGYVREVLRKRLKELT